jgi:hypothetical protein
MGLFSRFAALLRAFGGAITSGTTPPRHRLPSLQARERQAMAARAQRRGMPPPLPAAAGGRQGPPPLPTSYQPNPNAVPMQRVPRASTAQPPPLPRVASGRQPPPVPSGRTPAANYHGQRGYAIGLGARPTHQAQVPVQFTPDPTRHINRQVVGGSEGAAFLFGGEYFPVYSSNVRGMMYRALDNELVVEFLNGSAYLYRSVTFSMARSALEAQSKGGWVWDHLRVRGSRTAHQVPYRRIW